MPRTVQLTTRTDGLLRGGDVDFPVALKPISYEREGRAQTIPNRMAVVREDTGEPLAVVSDRYTLVPHQRILERILPAIDSLELGEVPSGLYLDRRGARMRALFKFPQLRERIDASDSICPCVRIQNTYDGTSRIAVHIGAFRFVCTNYAVGGGGVFAGGFMAVHSGEIPIEKVAEQLNEYLANFREIAKLYSHWKARPLPQDRLEELLEPLPKRPARAIQEGVLDRRCITVWDAYNTATYYATHKMRSYHGAFELLAKTNRSFQQAFPREDAKHDSAQQAFRLPDAMLERRRN